MSLETEFERVTLDLADAFTIARGTQETAENVVVRIADGEHTGIGGAAPSSHYGETADTVETVLPDLLAVVEEVDDPHALARVERRLREVVTRNPAARCAISTALHDLAAKRLDIPLYRYWGLDPTTVPTSFTIGLDTLDRIREKTAAGGGGRLPDPESETRHRPRPRSGRDGSRGRPRGEDPRRRQRGVDTPRGDPEDRDAVGNWGSNSSSSPSPPRTPQASSTSTSAPPSRSPPTSRV